MIERYFIADVGRSYERGHIWASTDDGDPIYRSSDNGDKKLIGVVSSEISEIIEARIARHKDDKYIKGAAEADEILLEYFESGKWMFDLKK